LDSLPTYHGPKKIFAVLEFQNATDYGSDQLSRVASDMLVTALKQSERFLLVERERLNLVLAEQALGQTGALDPDTRAKVGQVLGAQFLILGTITEFGFRDSEVKIPVKEALELAAAIAEGLEKSQDQKEKDRERKEKGKRKKKKEEVKASEALRAASAASPDEIHSKKVDTRTVIDVRAVEVKTGRVLWAEKAEGGDKGLTVHFRFGADQVGGGILYDETTAGKTLRRAIDRCVYDIALAMKERPWEGRIAKIGDRKVFVVGGRDAGIKLKEPVEIFKVEQGLLDPGTGEALEIAEEKMGRGEVVRVEEHYSVVEIQEGGGFSFNDLVKLVER
jgi:curli biogenesis system outer membrane secretion channel CsgG